MLVLEVVDLHVGYGKTPVIRGVSLTVESGEGVGIVGPNGAGKTTLLRCILGYIKPWKGRIVYQGVDVTNMPAYSIAKLGVGYVPERGGILRTLTVQENIELALKVSKHGADRLNDVRKLFRIVEERRNQVAGTLSGGEQRMLSLAIALLMADKLLVLDEPSAGLAPIVRRRLAEVLKYIKRDLGVSLLLAEQDPSLVIEVADTVHVVELGTLVRSGKPFEIVKVDVLREHYLGL